MSAFPDYVDHDACGLAELVRRGEVHPRELVEAAIEQIERWNPRVNAVVHRSFERARAEAERFELDPAQPFPGVPLLLKDLGAEDAGQPHEQGSALRRGVVAEADCELVARYKRAGLIVVGRTNTPEFGILGVTEPRARGATRNPWSLAHTPGGSSGGSGAAVAAGMVPMAHGGDGGGSIRIPASHCGLVGLKPTRGRNPAGPREGERWLGLTCEHVLTRSVRDSAAALDASAGPDPGAPYAAPPVEGSFAEQARRDPPRLRVAMCARALFGRETDPELLEGLHASAALVRELGHEVEAAEPDFDPREGSRAYVLIVAAGVARSIAEAERLSGRRGSAATLEPTSRMMARIAAKMSAADLQGAIDHMRRAGRRVARLFERFDLLLTPTVARPPVEIGEFALTFSEQRAGELLAWVSARPLILAAIDAVAGRRMAATPNTMLFNMTGQPAISLPLHRSAKGLPLGMQFVAPFGGEARLFSIAGQLERARPWAAPLRELARAGP